MAKNTLDNGEIRTNTKANMAIVVAVIALLFALVCLLFAVGARNQARDALNISNQTKTQNEDSIKKIMNATEKASPGGGVGPNAPLPTSGGNTQPNGNGQ